MLRKLTGLAATLAVVLLLSGHAARAEDAPAPPEGPLTLEECINIALGGHPKIMAAREDAEAGKWTTRQAISAFWPRVDFEASRNHISSKRQIRFGGANVTTTARYIANNFTFNTNWTLFDFGRTYYNVRGFAELEGSLLAGLTTAEQTVAYDVMESYFGLLSTQSLVAVTKETKAAADDHLKQAQAFYDVGVKPRFDVTQAEVEVNDAKLNVIVAEDAVKLARASLNTKLGYPPLTMVDVVDMPITGSPEGGVDIYIQRAMENRPELKSQEFNVRSADAGVKGAYADFLPRVSAGAAQNWYKEDHSDMLDNQNVQLTVDVPIFEGFRTASLVGEARARRLSAAYRLEDLKRDITLEVSRSFIAVEDAKARIDALESSVKKAQENLDIAQGRYEAGVGQFLEVTDAQVGLASAKTNLVKAKFEYYIAYSRLLRNTGAPVRAGETAQ